MSGGVMYIEAELNAMVWRIVVAPGDEVVEDAVLMILESMKMEIPVMSPTDGRVAEILVAEGDSVGEGQRLAFVTPDDVQD